MSAVALELVILVLLVIVNGTLALAEMAIVSSRKARLEQRAQAGDRGAQKALDLANNPTRFLSTIQVGITLVGILAGAFGGATLSRVLTDRLAQVPGLGPYSEPLSLTIIVVMITYLTLIFGELVPKRLALQNPETLASIVARPMAGLLRVGAPMVALLSASTDLVLRALGTRPSQEAPISVEEIRVLLEQGLQAGVFEASEQRMVDRIFHLGERRVGSLMSPRPEVVWIDVATPPEEVLRVVLSSDHTMFPICRGDLDNVVGIVAGKDILRLQALGQPWDVVTLSRPPVFVPDSVDTLRLLELLQPQQSTLAVVVDEYGAVEGVVTVTDILEAIVGEISVASGEEQPSIVRRDDGSLLVDGAVSIDELREVLEVDDILAGAGRDFNSVGGLVMEQLGHIPVPGERFEWGPYEVEVMDMDGRRVDTILIEMGNAVPRES